MGETPKATRQVDVAVGRPPRENTWVQVPRRSMEAIAKLIGESPAAGQLLMAMTSRMGHHNALVASYAALQELTGLSRSTVARSMQLLKERRFVSLVQLGQTKSTRAIVINDHVAWYGPRDGLRHSLFSAAVLATSSEQESMDEFENSEPLTEIPAVYKGEHQLPTGEGLPPPSAPSIPGLETPLPTRLEPS